MDCEKFDQHVLDALYDELDELTHAALRRHVEGCSRCAGVYAGLRATREVGILPIEEPGVDLEARILDAIAVAHSKTPWTRRALRGLAWAGSHAMRPQPAMAALFCLVIGSSLLLLRARPGTSAMAPVLVTERGSPGAEPAVASPPPAPSSPVRGRLAEGSDTTRAEGSADDARAALADARATRETLGCAAAVTRFDRVASRFAGTQIAADAMWDQAVCFRQMDQHSKAREIYTALLSTGYRDRAQHQLDEDAAMVSNQLAARSPAAKAASPAKPPKAADVSGGGRPSSAAAGAAASDGAAAHRRGTAF